MRAKPRQLCKLLLSQFCVMGQARINSIHALAEQLGHWEIGAWGRSDNNAGTMPETMLRQEKLKADDNLAVVFECGLHFLAVRWCAHGVDFLLDAFPKQIQPRFVCQARGQQLVQQRSSRASSALWTLLDAAVHLSQKDEK